MTQQSATNDSAHPAHPSHQFKSILSSVSPLHLIIRQDYESIIAMGTPALPYIFRDMQAHPDRAVHWLWVLDAITSNERDKHREVINVDSLVQHWLQWGREHDYLNLNEEHA